MTARFPRQFGKGNMARDARAMRVALARLGGTVQRRGFYFVPVDNPWTAASFAWSGYSTQGTSTLIDVSTVFTGGGAAPDNTNHVRAYSMVVGVADSASFPTGPYYFSLGPSATFWNALWTYCHGGDHRVVNNGIVPASATGDLYYRCVASGALSLDVHLQINGFFM